MDRKRIYKLLSWIWLFCVFGMWCAYLWKYSDRMLDSDKSSELLLGKLLSEENCFFTDKWFYSTEIRVLNTQIIYKLLFDFFSDWHLVRCISSIVWLIILLSCFYYLLRQSGHKNVFSYIAPVLILNSSGDYFQIILSGLYYYPHVCISFITIGMILQYMRINSKYVRSLLLVGMSILAFSAGMGGTRQIVILYFPLLLTSLIWHILESKEGNSITKDCILVSCISFSVSIAGYFVNKQVFAKIYSFVSWENINYRNFSVDALIEVLNGILSNLGFETGGIFSFSTMLNAGAGIIFLMMILCIYIGVTKKYKTSSTNRFISLFLFIGLIVLILLYTFTDMAYVSRYLLPNLVFVIPVIAVNLQESEYRQNIKKGISIACMIAIYVCGLYKYNRLRNVDDTAQIREITDYLTENDISNGYATYWNANVMTELSDGEIEVWAHEPGHDMLKDMDAVFRWLQLTEHVKKRPQGKLFVLFTQEEWDSCSLKELLQNKEVTYSNYGYLLYIFDSFDDLKCTLTEYKFDFYNNPWLINGEDRNGIRYLYKNGISYGPYMSLYPGTYEVIVRGENLDEATASCTYEAGGSNAEIEEFMRNTDQIAFRVYIKEKVTEAEIKISNLSDDIILISEISMHNIYQ